MPNITVELNARMEAHFFGDLPVLDYDKGSYPGIDTFIWSSRAYVFAKPVNIGCVIAQWDGHGYVDVELAPLNELDRQLYPSSFLPLRKNVMRRLPKGRKSNRWRVNLRISGTTDDFVLRNVRFASTPMELATV